MPTYSVILPIAGHVIVEVQAKDEKEAIRTALNADISTDDIETWEVLERFNQGNVCFCPSPWQAEADQVSDDEEAE